MALTQEGLVWMARAAILLLLTPLHECAHGFVAWRLGDNTAREQGRLTLNPLRHMDLVGSAMLVFVGFGWAKPVPVDPRRFRNPKRDMALTAIAGPLANLLFAAVLMVGLQVLLARAPYHRESYAYYLGQEFVVQLIFISLLLAVFNLLPIPPLDGSRIFGAMLPDKLYFGVMRYERYIMLALLLLLFFTDVITSPLQDLTLWLFDMLLKWTTPIGRIV